MYIPNDIIVTNILSRLPSKSLVRFLCVSTSWYSLITDDYFQTLYSSVNKAKKRRWIAFAYEPDIPFDYASAHFILYDEASPFVVTSSSLENNELRPFPLSTKDGKRLHLSTIVGSCNGLVCLFVPTSINHSCIWLWNPFIRKCKRVDLPTMCSSDSFFMMWGFGFANRSHDYKFVVVTKYGSVEREQRRYHIEIYSLRKMSWKRVIDAKLDEYVSVGMKQGCYLNGTCHWLCTSDIMCFNLDDENFYPINLPKIPNSKRYVDTIVYKDMLSVCTYVYPNDGNGDTFVDILAMKEYGCFDSWTCMVRVGLKPRLGWRCELYGADSNGRLFIRERCRRNDLMHNWKVYDPESKEMECKSINVFELVSCQESLVFL